MTNQRAFTIEIGVSFHNNMPANEVKYYKTRIAEKISNEDIIR